MEARAYSICKFRHEGEETLPLPYARSEWKPGHTPFVRSGTRGEGTVAISVRTSSWWRPEGHRHRRRVEEGARAEMADRVRHRVHQAGRRRRTHPQTGQGSVSTTGSGISPIPRSREVHGGGSTTERLGVGPARHDLRGEGDRRECGDPNCDGLERIIRIATCALTCGIAVVQQSVAMLAEVMR